MTLTPQQLDVYRTVVHPTMAPDDKSRAIDMAYGIGAPPPPLATDTRLAEGGPAADTPTVDNSWALDSGAVTPADAARSATASDAIMHPVIPPYVPPAPPAPAPVEHGAAPTPEHGGGAHGGAPTGHGEAPAAAAPPAPGEAATDEDVGPQIRALFQNMTQGGPVHAVAASSAPTATVTERGNPVPDAIKNKIAEDAAKEAGLAVQQGEGEATAHTNAAIGLANQAHQFRADAAQQAADDKAKADHLTQMDTEFQQTVKDTAAKPGDFWSSKDTGHKILSFISAIMFGLAGDPKGLHDVIERDLAKLATNREKTLSAAQAKVNDFRSRLLSPEAQEAAQRAFAFQAAAADANSLAEAAKAPEARMRGEQLAQQLQMQADMHAEEMAKYEAGTDRTSIKHTPAHLAGGARMSDEQAIAALTKMGFKGEQVLRAVGGGKYGTASTGDEADTRVHLPDGTIGYTSKDLHKDTQLEADALGGLQGDLGRIAELTKSLGSSIAGPDKAKLQARIASATTRLSAMAAGQGGNARMAAEMLKIFEPLTGANALDTVGSSANVRAGFDEAQSIYRGRLEALRNRMTKSPSGKGETLGVTEKSLGVKED